MTAELFDQSVKPVLYTIAFIGLTLFMFLVGAGQAHRPSKPREMAEPLLLATACSLAPLILGGIVAFLLADQLKEPRVSMLQYCLFVGGALSVTAFPMLARILYERDMAGTKFGSLAMLAASVDDAAAWCILAVVNAMGMVGGMPRALTTIGLAVAFCGLTLTLVPRLLRRAAERAVSEGHISHGLFAMLMLIVLCAGWFTDFIGIYSVFAGFVAGLAMPQVDGFRRLLHERMMDITSTLLLPVFFAFSGLNTRLSGVWTWSFVAVLAVLLITGFVSKYAFGVLAMRGLGYNLREASAMGGLMNARGLMILIFINIGLANGIIGDRLFGMLVLVAVITTALAMPIYRRSFGPAHEAEARAEVAMLEPSSARLPATAASAGRT